jgi:uncharacterized protein HemY
MLEEDTRKTSPLRDWWRERREKALDKAARRPEREKALLGMAYYVRVEEGSEWVLRPRWRVLAPVLFGVIALVHATAATCMYWSARYIHDCPTTPYWEMYIYVIPNRVPFTNFVFMPEFLNKHVMAVRKRQTLRMNEILRRNPQNLEELFWVARTKPDDVEIQFQAAHFLASTEWKNRLKDAMEVLEHTLPYIVEQKETTSQNLMRYAQFCYRYEQDDYLIAAARKYLETPELAKELGEDSKTSLAISYAESLYLKGDFEKASEVLDKYRLLGYLPGYLLKTRIVWENGEQERAITLLNHFIKATGDERDRERLLYALAKFQWEQNKFSAAAATLGKIVAAKPDDYKPRVRQLSMLASSDDSLRRAAAIDEILTQFGANENAMLSLGSYAAEVGDVNLQRRIEALAGENRFSKLSSFHLLVIETLVTAGRHKEALEQIGDLFMRKPIWLQNNPDVRLQFEALRMLGYFAGGQTDIGNATLDNLMRGNNLPLSVMVATARRLLTLNQHNEAKRLLLQAYSRNHNSQSVLLELVKMDLQSESTEVLGGHLTDLLAGRRPPRYVLRGAYEYLGSDRFLFTRNREKMLDQMDFMLRTRNLPVSEFERSWPGAPDTVEDAVTPLPLKRS